MTDQAAIDNALDALEIENDITPEVIEPEVIEPEVIEPEIEEPKVNPPGYIDNIDDWIKAGKDPDLFKGKKAYEAEYDRIQEIKELKGLVKTVVDTTNDWKQQQQVTMNAQVEQARVDARAELETAKDASDIEAALAAQDKLNNLNKPVSQPTAQPATQMINDFVKANPILDQESPQYNQEFHLDLQMTQNAILDRLTGGNRDIGLTEGQIKRSLSLALAQTKELHPEKFKSPRNSRRGGSTTPAKRTPTAPTGDYSTRLKAMNIPSMNKRDVNAQADVYEMIKEIDPKRAETFAKNILGE